MSNDLTPGQHDQFRKLFEAHDGQQEALIAADAAADRAGLMKRKSEMSGATASLVGPEQEGLARPEAHS